MPKDWLNGGERDMISRAKARAGRYAEWNCARIFLWYNDTQTTMSLIPLKSSFPVIPVSLPTLTFFLFISLVIQKIILLFPPPFFLLKEENEQPSPKSVLLNHFVPCSIFFPLQEVRILYLIKRGMYWEKSDHSWLLLFGKTYFFLCHLEGKSNLLGSGISLFIVLSYLGHRIYKAFCLLFKGILLSMCSEVWVSGSYWEIS